MVKMRSNETEEDAISKLFGDDWIYSPIISLVQWSNVGKYYVDIIYKGEKKRVDIEWSILPNILKLFKSLVRKKSISNVDRYKLFKMKTGEEINA